MKRNEFLKNVLFGFTAAFVPKAFQLYQDPFDKIIYSLKEETSYENSLGYVVKNRDEGETSMAITKADWELQN